MARAQPGSCSGRGCDPPTVAGLRRGGVPADGRELTADQHRAAAVTLVRVWERIGFAPFQDGVHILDCHLQQPQDLLAERLEEFNALCST